MFSNHGLKVTSLVISVDGIFSWNASLFCVQKKCFVVCVHKNRDLFASTRIWWGWTHSVAEKHPRLHFLRWHDDEVWCGERESKEFFQEKCGELCCCRENSKELNAEEDCCGEIARLNLWRKKAKRLLITLLWRNHKSLIVWSLQQDYIWGKNHVVKV